MDGQAGREAELRANLDAVRARIERGCVAAGRAVEEVTLVVVTKHFPASDVRLLHDLGVVHVGENKHQEAAAKREECADLGLVWHYIGHLQSNKAAAVGGWADVVQSVDRDRLIPGLARAAVSRERRLEVLVQVSLDSGAAGAGRSGADPEDVPALVDAVLGEPALRLRGVMAVAPWGAPAGPAFARLAEVAAAVRQRDAEACWISAGMSGDLEEAIRYGATHVRVGSAVLGNRPPRG